MFTHQPYSDIRRYTAVLIIDHTNQIIATYFRQNQTNIGGYGIPAIPTLSTVTPLIQKLQPL